MNYLSLFSGFMPSLQGNSKDETGAARHDSPSEVANPNSSKPLEVVKSVTSDETDDDLPIGEAIPNGEHVRSLRVFSSERGEGDHSQRQGTKGSSRDSSRGVREVQVLQVFRNPDVMLAPNLLTKGQCLHLLELAEGKWTRSKTSIGISTAPQTDFTTRESRTRTSKSAMLDAAQTPGVASVELLVCALARLPLQHLEPLVLVRYDEGEYFNEHHDGAFRPQTVLLYLNDVEEGGFTHFTRLGLKIAPAQGCGAVWGNVTPKGTMDMRMVHAGVPPTKGTKYAVNCFFNETVIRSAQPEPPLSAPEKAEEVFTTQNGFLQELPHEPATLQGDQHSGNQIHVQPPMIMPALQSWPVPLQSWGGPECRSFSHQAAWGTAMLQVFRQLRHQEMGNHTYAPRVAETSKSMSPTVGLPSNLACPPDFWRGHVVAGMPQGRHWLHSWPPKSS